MILCLLLIAKASAFIYFYNRLQKFIHLGNERMQSVNKNQQQAKANKHIFNCSISSIFGDYFILFDRHFLSITKVKIKFYRNIFQICLTKLNERNFAKCWLSGDGCTLEQFLTGPFDGLVIFVKQLLVIANETLIGLKTFPLQLSSKPAHSILMTANLFMQNDQSDTDLFYFIFIYHNTNVPLDQKRNTTANWMSLLQSERSGEFFQTLGCPVINAMVHCQVTNLLLLLSSFMIRIEITSSKPSLLIGEQLCRMINSKALHRFCVTIQCRAEKYGGAVMGSRVGIDLFHSVRCSSGCVTNAGCCGNQFAKKG
ncbi:hypothetical protein T4D_15923 [Trichinella pseudospiralis]|uniref:Uncharacterized protein n=1 Tax=Trichinella pseudospiralis TaxID=6337 RepID=A0A0V1FH33_TRIPS|nr:hypothetical protein T4D_15923 [Trichinella pseudospiralis]